MIGVQTGKIVSYAVPIVSYAVSLQEMQVLSNVFIKPFLCKLYAYIMSPQPMILFTKKQTYISNYFFQIL